MHNIYRMQVDVRSGGRFRYGTLSVFFLLCIVESISKRSLDGKFRWRQKWVEYIFSAIDVYWIDVEFLLKILIYIYIYALKQCAWEASESFRRPTEVGNCFQLGAMCCLTALCMRRIVKYGYIAEQRWWTLCLLYVKRWATIAPKENYPKGYYTCYTINIDGSVRNVFAVR